MKMEHFGTNFIVSETPYRVSGPGRWSVTGTNFMFYPEEGKVVIIKAGVTPVYIGGYPTEDGKPPCVILPGRALLVTLAVNDEPGALGLWTIGQSD
jgi:hypothetical protein